MTDPKKHIAIPTLLSASIWKSSAHAIYGAPNSTRNRKI